MNSATAIRPNTDRDIRELAQAIATIEVVMTTLAIEALAGRPTVADRLIRDLADRAVFERDGCDPVMLDRIADRLSAGHAAVA